jgi:PilZ domain
MPARPNDCDVAEHVYERSALILDGEDHRLAEVSASLSVLGHQLLYADDLEDLVSLAREYRARVGALILPAEHAAEWWPAVRKRLVEPLAIAPRAVLSVGERIAEADAEALHRDGLRWALWEPFTPWELRFAVTMVLSETDPNDVRLETRVPCAVAIEVVTDSRRTPAQLTDLSTGGALVQIARPHAQDTVVVLRGELGGRRVSLPARVAWRSGPHSPGWRDPGMGVSFERVELGVLDLLRQEIERALDRFRLRPNR